MTNGPIITEPGPVHPDTGTRRLDVWREDASGGMWGDDAVGAGFTARYVSDDGYGCAEVSIYPVVYEPTTDEVDQHALMQGATREEVADASIGELIARYGKPPGLYGVDECSTYGRAVYDLTDDTSPRPADDAEISYEGGSALTFNTLKQAQAEAERLGMIDQSRSLYLRKREEES